MLFLPDLVEVRATDATENNRELTWLEGQERLTVERTGYGLRKRVNETRRPVRGVNTALP
ncbi:hypothetical protein [Tunturiibacter lichenicola]|uniref:hypothetical protein n=1 Tax=Tunturiibacter lichenicola TaxID=2051959 RepID=UPI003D9BAB29